MRKTMIVLGLGLGLALATAGTAVAQRSGSTMGDAKEVVTQPGRDVGIGKGDVPPVLARAADSPYGSAGTRTCAQLTAGIRALNRELGPDFGAGAQRGPSVVRTGGAAVVNTILPFRGIVREVSGAASADRRIAAATQAGIARRGYLRGLYTQRGCRTGM